MDTLLPQKHAKQVPRSRWATLAKGTIRIVCPEWRPSSAACCGYEQAAKQVPGLRWCSQRSNKFKAATSKPNRAHSAMQGRKETQQAAARTPPLPIPQPRPVRPFLSLPPSPEVQPSACQQHCRRRCCSCCSAPAARAHLVKSHVSTHHAAAAPHDCCRHGRSAQMGPSHSAGRSHCVTCVLWLW